MSRRVVLVLLAVLVGGVLLVGVRMQRQGDLPWRTSTARQATVMGQWSMTTTGDAAASLIGEEPMILAGPWKPAVGSVGDAVDLSSRKTAYGVAYGTEADNPGENDFGLGVTFTSEPLTPGVGFSGNVVQKGRAADDGQVKVSTLPTKVGAATFCRVEGTNGFVVLKSKVPVDDEVFHTAVCWREGGTVGLTVDGVETRLDFDPGDIRTDEPVRIGNQASEGNWTDQHFGLNDCTVWVIGRGAGKLAGSLTPC